MVNATASWTDEERFVAMASSGHALIVDSDRKRNTGGGPMELVLIGLCACTATDIVSILTKKRERFTSIEVRAEGERAKTPPMVYETIKLVYKVGGKVPRKAVQD